jgi:hypothetical protein
MMALSSKSGEEDHECSTPKLAGATMGEHCRSTPEEDEATVVESCGKKSRADGAVGTASNGKTFSSNTSDKRYGCGV